MTPHPPHLPDTPPRSYSRRSALRLAAATAGGGVFVAVAAACGNDAAGEFGRMPTTTEAPRPTALVRSIDNTFNPEVITVAAGTEVVWVNGGRVDHDILAVDESWGVAVEDFPPKAEFRRVFDTPGTYEYICTLHGSMKMVGMVGTVIVT